MYIIVPLLFFAFAGGNCHTAMIATISMEAENLAETLSTCRFAQRVACITNVVRSKLNALRSFSVMNNEMQSYQSCTHILRFISQLLTALLDRASWDHYTYRFKIQGELYVIITVLIPFMMIDKSPLILVKILIKVWELHKNGDTINLKIFSVSI